MYARQHAIEHPDKAAIIMATSGETLSYADFKARANQVAHLLQAAGLQRGDHISIFMENNARMLEIEGGAERTGLYYTLINSYLAPAEVAYIVTNSCSRLLFSSAAKREAAVGAAAQCPQLERLLMTGADDLPVGWESYDSARAGFPAGPVPDESLAAAMLYSSGTTGQPKGVLRELLTVSPDEPLPVMEFVRAMFGFRDGMTYLNPAPLYHSAPAASVGVHCHAAAPCPVHVKQAMIDWLGPVITEYYGATEAHGFTFCDSAEWLAHPGTVGRPILGELLILDSDGHQCPTGVDGKMWFRGATACAYFRDPVKTAESLRDGGVTSTVGDVGHVDADGYLYLTDRKSYMIISGGVNIYPQETENLLSGHPAVMDVAVIGVPNDDLGEEVKAVVQLADPAAAGPELEQELISYCRDRLTHFKCPRTIDFVTDLPRSPTGKLYKRLLRDAYWAGHQTSIV
jgi:long-chain acyl-CoA synthetase